MCPASDKVLYFYLFTATEAIYKMSLGLATRQENICMCMLVPIRMPWEHKIVITNYLIIIHVMYICKLICFDCMQN